MTNPVPSLLYGVGVFLVSVAVVWFLFSLELDYALFPLWRASRCSVR